MAIPDSSNGTISDISIPTPYRSPEIVIFDVETNVPTKSGQKFQIFEFGALVFCPKRLVELESFHTVIRPTDLSTVPIRSGRTNGITRDTVKNAPLFIEVSEKIFSILNGRIWAGHNIQRFDCPRIKEAFADIGRPAPTCAGIIDSLKLLTKTFGKRAGNMKMATLAEYFELGQQKHRSLEDVRMNFEVLKSCAMVLLLESSLPNVLNPKGHISTGVTTRSRRALELNVPRVKNEGENHISANLTSHTSKGKLTCREETSRKSPPSTSLTYQRTVPYARVGLTKMTESMRSILCNPRTRPLNHLLKHSQSLLR